jgi:hypothetical protein
MADDLDLINKAREAFEVDPDADRAGAFVRHVLFVVANARAHERAKLDVARRMANKAARRHEEMTVELLSQLQTLNHLRETTVKP